jgi:hypothetical protein
MTVLQALRRRVEAVETTLTRRENMIRFLLGRLLLMGLMLTAFVVGLQRS